jgi:hypothetical protein
VIRSHDFFRQRRLPPRKNPEPEQIRIACFVTETGEPMKPRFFTNPVGVSDAIETACRTYSMIYDKPGEAARLAVESYVHRLVAKGERNQDQLTLKAIIYLKKHGGRASLDS